MPQTPSKSPSQAALFSAIWCRIKAQFWLKTFGIPAFNAAFFLGYFLILNHPLFAVKVMPLTALDRVIPYQTSMWAFYVSLWLYVQLPPSLTVDRKELILYGFTAGLVSLVGFLFFVLWPTAVPTIQVAGGSTFERIRGLDTTGNSCPSLHVAFSVFSAVWLDNFLRRYVRSGWLRWGNLFWCLGIVYSTLGTKQHVFLDALAGIPLGVGGAWIQICLTKRLAAPAGENPADLGQSSPAARKL